MVRLNCWEFKKCGREPGGEKTAEFGICPATSDASAHGLNGGTNGGRICWSVAGTLSGVKAEGTFAKEKFTCISCDFFNFVENEEGIKNIEILTPTQLDQYKGYRARIIGKTSSANQEHCI